MIIFSIQFFKVEWKISGRCTDKKTFIGTTELEQNEDLDCRLEFRKVQTSYGSYNLDRVCNKSKNFHRSSLLYDYYLLSCVKTLIINQDKFIHS